VDTSMSIDDVVRKEYRMESRAGARKHEVKGDSSIPHSESQVRLARGSSDGWRGRGGGTQLGRQITISRRERDPGVLDLRSLRRPRSRR